MIIMKNYLFKLENVIQPYAWGSKNYLSDLFNIANPDKEPQAELWMGVHQNGCSKNAESGELLSDFVNNHKMECLGGNILAKFDNLPFLFKVLAADEPLSIQVHPNLAKAQLGFEKENNLQIDIKSPYRNYKDPNHKPELIYALTDFEAMNGFRDFSQILSFFLSLDIEPLAGEVQAFKENQTPKGLEIFFSSILNLEGDRKSNVIDRLLTKCDQTFTDNDLNQAVKYIKVFTKYYQNDIGFFAPLFLHIVHLQKGQAMFLYAGRPHAYIKGCGLEIMANSDNVLRGGLTPKHIDVPELLDNTDFIPVKYADITMEIDENNVFQTPVDDFKLAILDVKNEVQKQEIQTAQIIFCIEGEVVISSEQKSVVLKKGESAFVGACLASFEYQGQGKLARAFV